MVIVEVVVPQLDDVGHVGSVGQIGEDENLVCYGCKITNAVIKIVFYAKFNAFFGFRYYFAWIYGFRENYRGRTKKRPKSFGFTASSFRLSQ